MAARRAHDLRSMDADGADDVPRALECMCAPESSPAETASALSVLEAALVASPATLLVIVGALGPFLTSTDARVRSRGTDVLARLVDAVRASPIESRSVAHLAGFFASRLDDLPCILPSLRGLHALVGRELPPAELVVVIDALLVKLHVPSLAQVERLAAYGAIGELVGAQARPICASGNAPAVALGVAKAVEGEKDPRNLLVSFALVGRTADALHVDVDAAGAGGGAMAAEGELGPALDELFD
ncbi:Dos2-interacting transcription regulator of RNA-Pol-II-domain-containing protein, partial [Pavlovales sp. CCMP2436]